MAKVLFARIIINLMAEENLVNNDFDMLEQELINFQYALDTATANAVIANLTIEIVEE